MAKFVKKCDCTSFFMNVDFNYHYIPSTNTMDNALSVMLGRGHAMEK